MPFARCLFSHFLFAAIASVAISSSASAADAPISLHGVSFSESAAATQLLMDSGVTPPPGWDQLDGRAKLVALTAELGVDTLGVFDSSGDLIDVCAGAIASRSMRSHDHVLASLLYTLLATKAVEEGESFDPWYQLLVAFKHEETSLTIFKDLRKRVLASTSISEVERFIAMFPRTVNISAAEGRLFALSDAEAQKQLKNGDLSGAIQLYQSFISRSPDSGLTTVAWERIDLATFQHLQSLSISPETASIGEWKQWTAARVLVFESYIRQFPNSLERVNVIAQLALDCEREAWEAQRKAIDPASNSAAAQISTLILEIGNSGFIAYDQGRNANSKGEELVFTQRARRRYEYLAELVSKELVKQQFAGHATVIADAFEAVQAVQSNLELTRIEMTLSEIHETLQGQAASLGEIATNVNGLVEIVNSFANDIGQSFAQVQESLDAVKGNVVALDNKSKETLAVIRAGFDDVNTHISISNQSLDALVTSVGTTNDLLTTLADKVDSGFESTGSTVLQVSERDFTNGRYWQVKEAATRKYLQERYNAAEKFVQRLFGFVGCQLTPLEDLLHIDHSDPDVHVTATMEAQYQVYKQEVKTKFSDHFQAVCNLKGEGANAEFIDEGDCAWRTSLYLCCVALEGDNVECQRVLQVLDKCWDNGEPRRHPDPQTAAEASSTDYSSDQFMVHWTGLYLAYRYGDDQTKLQARALAKRFVDKLAKDDWKLTEDSHAHFNAQRMIGRYFVMLVSREMGLDRLWADAVDAAAYGFYREGWFASLEMRAIEAAATTPSEPTSFHNLFWEFYTVILCEGGNELLKQRACELSVGAESQEMALFMWLGGKNKKLGGWLDNWPSNWTIRDYVWQRSRAQNNESPNAGESYPRLDYMVLVRLIAKGNPL